MSKKTYDACLKIGASLIKKILGYRDRERQREGERDREGEREEREIQRETETETKAKTLNMCFYRISPNTA